jgi:mannitol/fructose-specific phosphotransferase system IIA component (Ntr-type)
MRLLEDFILDVDSVCFLEKTSPYLAIETLVKSLPCSDENRADDIKQKVLEREGIALTAIGKEIAIPHARCSFLDDFYLAIGVCREGISWEALDGEAVKIICLIAGPEDRHRDYLSFLSFVTSILKEEQTRQNILSEEDKKNIVNIFRSC